MEENSKIYKHKCKNGGTATITYIKINNDWVFQRCEYYLSNLSKYSLKDWEDLKELSTEILKLNKELTKYNGIAPVAFAE